MIKKLIAISMLVGLFCSARAQYDPDKVNKKAKASFEKAYSFAMNGNYAESIKTLQDAIKLDPRYLEAYLSIAGLYSEQKNYPIALENYEKAKAIDSNWFKEYDLPYSINLAGMGEFQKALTAIDEFLAIPNLNPQSKKAANYRRKTYQFAIDYSNQHPAGNYKFSPQNMGDSINSNHLEYFPTFTIDDKDFIFTRRVNGNEEFYESHFENGHWTKAAPLPGDINSNLNEGASNISQDGQWLIFTGCNFPYGYGSCDLYISYLTPEGWSKPENMGNRINTESWESAPSLSADKRDLYFASNRPGGYGGQDLYVCRQLPNSRWSDPENLGPEINTIGDESAPFIHADNQTLYFTSAGHLGYGGSDLFMAKKQGKGWSKPINLGYPINTIENEGSLVIAADGKTAYYTSDRTDSRGGLDLYSFQLRDDISPARTLWVKGKVFDKKTLKGLPSGVELTDLGTREVISRVQTDATGNYLITLPVGKDYAFNVKRRGYLFFSENFPLSQKAPDSTYKIDIPLQPIEANASVVLKNIFFESGKFDLKDESTIELDNIFQLMKENPTLKIQISGHTDNVGKAADNLALSNNRAQAVVKFLVSKGIEQARLTFKGFGATQPVADNATEEGRAQNRRTELQVISQ
ncbi:flagellar motor protein MotB [Niastella yeongjuensis]|uniref:Flagellar motor protein MotB n=1 Tax=Niastella yeongjuensis TaxID=354355 RepID=A0A1V9FC25_9BACT|nr:OmpA family protein [Niastella yeongjuensis]OQP55950.1 flagellar motor protein MotB [Niastella yeongjuensis]